MVFEGIGIYMRIITTSGWAPIPHQSRTHPRYFRSISDSTSAGCQKYSTRINYMKPKEDEKRDELEGEQEEARRH